MAQTQFKGTPAHTSGELPSLGAAAPDFKLITTELKEISLADFKGKRLILNIFPSIDTGICATSVRKFNVEAAQLKNTVVLCISKDLPFAAGRFCGAEGIKNVSTGSSFKNTAFETAYGVQLTDTPLQGLMARAIVVLDENSVVRYTELVPEIAQEPDYARALGAL